jgi:elongation factor P
MARQARISASFSCEPILTVNGLGQVSFYSFGTSVVATYKTNDFKKGLKIQIDGEPYLMTEVLFVKPGKGNALYKCRMKNLIRNTVLDRTYKGGDELESADIEEIATQFLYRQGDTFVFMDSTTFEQYELTAEQVDDNWKYLKEGMLCTMMLYNGNPIIFSPPNHVELKIIECDPGAKGDTATNVTKNAKAETGGDFIVPGFIKEGNVIKIDTRTGEYVERVNN